MVDWVGWLLKAVNFKCFLIGLTNFEFDQQSGRVFKSRRCTLYAASINIIFCISLVYCLIEIADFTAMSGKTNKLQASVVFTVTGLRIIAGDAMFPYVQICFKTDLYSTFLRTLFTA